MAGLPVLYKPGGSAHSASPGNPGVLLAPGDYKAVQLINAEGKVVDNLRSIDTHSPEAGQTGGEFGAHYVSKVSADAVGPGGVLKIVDASGKSYYVSLGNGQTSFRGHVDSGEGDSFQNAAVLPVNPHSEGGGGGGASGVPPGFAAGTSAGGFGSIPAYLGGMFPAAQLANYNPITAAPYTFTDPIAYAQKFGDFNRGEIQKNYDQAKNIASDELNTELSSLKSYVPAAAALKQQTTSLDNQFNQQQRTNQVNTVLPNANPALADQAKRAATLATGNLPDSIQNSALELGIRSAAADSAAAGGFGASSSVARKASDLLSATQRLNISKYGDQLVSSNINQSAALNLAPTEYSNAGTQVNVNPSLSATQLINSNLNAINGLTTITPGQGLSSTTQQQQYSTNLQQATNTFNATNELQNSQFNAGAQNNFALDQFGYNAGFANSVAGAQQTDINTQLQLQQQAQFTQLAEQYLSMAQLNQGIGSATSALGTIGKVVTGGKGGKAVVVEVEATLDQAFTDVSTPLEDIGSTFGL